MSLVTMDEANKKALYGDVIFGSASETSDADEDEDDIPDEDTFDLPLKSTFLQNTNFSELSESGEESFLSDAKRVRFNQEKDNDAVLEGPQLSRNNSASVKSRRHVETLIQQAGDVNDYVAENMDRITSFGDDFMKDKELYRSASNSAILSSQWGSISNFQLSEVDWDNEGNKRRRSSSNMGLDDELSGDNTSKLDDSIAEYKVVSTAEIPSANGILQTIAPLRKLHIRNDEDEVVEGNSMLIRTDVCQPDPVTITVIEALENFRETIETILSQSGSNGTLPVLPNSELSIPEDVFKNFCMKSTAAISYSDFIDRIQSKCSFGAVIYLEATYLLMTLFLTRENTNGPLVLKHSLEESQVHRIIIATIRIAAKLLEDFVHSHEYVSKVCGISKRLLTRLEESLLICLQEEGLMVTSAKLGATIQVFQELQG